MKWISVEDRLPDCTHDPIEDNSKNILAFDAANKQIYLCYASKYQNNPTRFYVEDFKGDFDIILDDVTHWMPLPEPPATS